MVAANSLESHLLQALLETSCVIFEYNSGYMAHWLKLLKPYGKTQYSYCELKVLAAKEYQL